MKLKKKKREREEERALDQRGVAGGRISVRGMMGFVRRVFIWAHMGLASFFSKALMKASISLFLYYEKKGTKLMPRDISSS